MSGGERGAPGAAGDAQVVPLGMSRGDRLRFLRAGDDIYRGDPHRVLPLTRDFLRRTDPAANPFFRHAEVAHFVLRRGGRDAGRIAAVRNGRAEEFRGDRTGYFGWFECPDDDGAAGALVGAARAWLEARDCSGMLGPVSYSTNDECGLLVDGFDGPPCLMMPYNPPWYERLLLRTGLVPAEDLLAWDLDYATVRTDRMRRIVERARLRHRWSLRPLRMDRFDDDIERIREVYNAAWERNWGFVPMSAEEFRFAAGDLRAIVDPALVLLAEVEGRCVGFSLALPDMNQVLLGLGGSLFPLGWLRALWWARRVHRLRVLALGVLPAHRGQGIDAGLYLATVDAAAPRGYTSAECSWTLSRNAAMGAALEALGARVIRRYRLYTGAPSGA